MGFRKMLGVKGSSSSKPKEPTKSERVAAENAINAVGNLAENEERLEKKRALLEKKMDEELGRAREFSKHNKKQQALMALKKKKMYESQLEQTTNLILRVNEQRMMLENQRQTAQVLHSMHNAATAAKQTMQALSVDDVDDLMGKIGDQNDEMMQIQDALAQPSAMGNLDEDDLDEELRALEEEVLDEQLLERAPVPAGKQAADELAELPSAPKTTTPVEDELADFAAELAG